MRALVLALIIALAGCASVQPIAQSTNTFAVCKTVDIASTAYGIHAGLVHEANPLMASTLAHGYFPMIALGVGLWYLLERLNEPKVTMVANVITCGVAANNLRLIR